MTDAEMRAEFKQEAEGMRQLPESMQRTLIAEQRAIAADAEVPEADREYARKRAAALQRYLFGKKSSRKARK
jgi:hypothetical protein